ncbi:DUF433 domain-containing protein [Halapricum desulfuricans]|uniref:Putative antitoxin of wHTH fold n=1 Tax=Halapricum desulfuricans TaxID=2841257 RepID=A0A897NU96_9EURY|nr:DUF433 domain-containing protein [Halapricum desulfuricans]QSG16004.1 putative antitoxin of wHTH fold [Halapricum desulfuricans]
MSTQTARIAKDLLDEPHIEGRRIPVLTIAERVEGRGLEPKTVADRYDLDVTEVYAALLYYHEHPRAFEELRRERDELMDEIEADINRPEGVSPPN